MVYKRDMTKVDDYIQIKLSNEGRDITVWITPHGFIGEFKEKLATTLKCKRVVVFLDGVEVPDHGSTLSLSNGNVTFVEIK